MSDADRRLIDRIHELAEDRNRWRMRAQDAEQERDQLAASLRRLDAEPKKSFSERHPRLTIAGWIVWTPIALALYGSMFYIVIHLIVTGDAPSF